MILKDLEFAMTSCYSVMVISWKVLVACLEASGTPHAGQVLTNRLVECSSSLRKVEVTIY
jgi:hypothetical protein